MRLRRAAAPSWLSARFWPPFPYETVGRSYDAVLPMSYSTHRVSGPAATYDYTAGSQPGSDPEPDARTRPVPAQRCTFGPGRLTKLALEVDHPLL